MKKCAIRAEIALLLTNQIAGNAIDLKMNILSEAISLVLVRALFKKQKTFSVFL